MLRSEFIEASKRARRVQNLWSWVFVGILFCGALIFAPLAKRFETSQNWMGDMVLLLSAALVWLVFAVVAVRKSAKQDVTCTSCRKSLMGFANQVVVSSGRCGHCGARVLEDPD